MGTTPAYGFPFPEPDDEPDGPEQIGALAEAADSSLAAHAEATADVHGIADTGVLETQDGAAQKASDALDGAIEYTDTNAQPNAVLQVSPFVALPSFSAAHRGFGGEYPEHTAMAYRSAVGAGAQALEVSVGLTRDRMPVCFHDASLDRMTGGTFTGPLQNWTYAALHEQVKVKPQGLLGAGWSDQDIPTMREVLDAHLGKVIIFLEPKTSASVPVVQQQLLDFYPHAQRSVVWKVPFDSNSLPWARSHGFTTWGYIQTTTTLAQMTAQNDLIDVWGVPMNASDAKFQEVLSFNKPVMVWEVHRFSEMTRMQNLGVQGLMIAEGHYLSSTGPIETTDSFASQIKAPGNIGSVNYDPAYAMKFESPNLAYAPHTGGHGISMGSMSRMASGSNGYQISFDMMFPVIPAAGLHAGLALCKASDDVYQFNGTANASGGYHFIFRAASGDIQLYRHDAGVQSGTQLGTTGSLAAVAGQWMSFTVKVTPTQIIIDRTDQATTLTVSNTAFRGLFFHIHNGSLSSTTTLPRWRNMRVDPV
jgi:glycerophosphoryl diester phosphodiesterase